MYCTCMWGKLLAKISPLQHTIWSSCSLITDLQGSWFTGNLNIVLQLGLCATGPQREYTPVLQCKFNQLTTGVYWQYLHVHAMTNLKRGGELSLCLRLHCIPMGFLRPVCHLKVCFFNQPHRCLLLRDRWMEGSRTYRLVVWWSCAVITNSKIQHWDNLRAATLERILSTVIHTGSTSNAGTELHVHVPYLSVASEVAEDGINGLPLMADEIGHLRHVTTIPVHMINYTIIKGH